MTDPVELLRELYPKLDNGQKQAAKEAGESILEMRTRIADLESTLARQLPEAPVSMTAKVIHAATQIEWLVTVRDAGAARLLISAMPVINEALRDQGLIALDAYVDGRRAERDNGKAALPAPGAAPNCPDGHGLMKASTKVAGEWYCSFVVGTHPQTDKKLYCTHKAKT